MFYLPRTLGQLDRIPAAVRASSGVDECLASQVGLVKPQFLIKVHWQAPQQNSATCGPKRAWIKISNDWSSLIIGAIVWYLIGNLPRTVSLMFRYLCSLPLCSPIRHSLHTGIWQLKHNYFRFFGGWTLQNSQLVEGHLLRRFVLIFQLDNLVVLGAKHVCQE